MSFKGPGYAADAFIDRESGHYKLTPIDHGFIAVINDLHKGRDTGPVWSVVIDSGGRPDDRHLADRAGTALLPQAQARSRPRRGPGRHGHYRRGVPVLGAVRTSHQATHSVDRGAPIIYN